MAQLVGGGIGAAIGFAVGGPAGAQWGWALGAAVGNSFTTIKQPRIGDLAEIRAGEGGPRARVYGTFRPIGGQVVWSGKPREIRRRQRQGKGGPKVQSSTILRSYAIGICEGPITSVSRIWRNNELVYDVRPGSTILAESARWLQGKTILLGGWDQLPHPTIEAEAGAANAPAMRGTALLVVTDEDLTDVRGAIPAYQFEVGASVCPQVPGGVQLATFEAAHTDATIRAVPGGVYATSGEVATSVGGTIQFLDLSNTLSTVADRSYITTADPGLGDDRFEFVGGDSRRYVLGEDGNFGLCDFWKDGQWRAYLFPNSTIGDNWFFGALQNRSDAVWWSDSHVYLCFTTSTATPSTSPESYTIYRWPITASGMRALPDAQSIKLNTGVAAPNMRFHRSRDGNIHAYSQEDNLWRVFNADLALIDSFVPTFSISRPIGADGPYLFHGGASATPGVPALFVRNRSDFSLVREIPVPYLSGPVFSGVNWSVTCNESVIVVQSVGRAVTIDYSPNCGIPSEGSQSSLAAIVSSVCANASLDSSLTDVSELPAVGVPGFSTSPDYSAAEALRELAKVYFFDVQDADGKVRFIPRGGNFAAILTEDEFVEGEDEPETDTTRDALSVPRLLHLQYFDVNGGQGPDKQFSERQISTRTEAPTVLQTPIVLDAETAARTIRVQHQVMEEELRGELVFGVSDRRIALAESDVVVVQYRGRSQRARITKVMQQDGWQQLTCVRDRQSAYSATVQPIPPAEITRPPESIPGTTRFAFLDLPALTQSGDVLSYHLATSGEQAGWRGAAIERQEAGAQFELLATDGTGTVMGTLVAALPEASPWYPDESNAVVVQLARADDELEGISREVWLARGNAAALVRADGTAEVIQFRDAVETTPGTWRLTGLQRGRLNSGASAHAAGTVFVLLDGALLVQAPSERLATTLTHRAYSVGDAPTTGTTQARTWTGRSQREWPPIIEAAARTGDTLDVAWAPRHRFGSDENPVPSSHFDGWQVSATDGTATVTAQTLAPTAALNVAGLGNPVTVTVRGRNRLAGLGDPATRTVP